MIATLKLILVLAGSLWALGCLIFVVALAAAAGKPAPDIRSGGQGKGRLGGRMVSEARHAERVHTV